MDADEAVHVPEGHLDCHGHHLFMVASFDGYCYLVNKETGLIYWRVPTNGLLCVADQGKNVDDYAGIKQVGFQCQLYHYKTKASNPQLIPYDNEELLKEHFNGHYEDEKTYVFKKDNYYLIDYQNGNIIHSFDSHGNVLESDKWTDYFLIRREDFYLHRSSPLWSVRYARIKAWFPSTYKDRTICFVYHAPSVQSYINTCIDYKFNRFPGDCPVNKLITEKNSMSEENIELREGNANTMEELRKLNAKNKSRMNLSVGKHIKRGDNGNDFFHGMFDQVDALIERAKSCPHVEETVKKLRLSSYHPNILTFLGSKSDDDHDYFAYERCGKTLKDYISNENTRYEEMSEQSIRIMSGLVSGIAHLHTIKRVHKNLSLDNIWMTDDNTIKIGGLWNSEILQSDEERRPDLYEVGQAILVYMSKGTHNPSPAKTLLLKGQFNNLKIPGTHKEVWDLLHKLHAVHPEHWPIQSPARLCKHINFWSASDRLRYFQDLSSYLEDTVPRPEPLITALKNLTVVTHGNPFSDWSTKFNKGVVTAMESVPDRSVAQPSDSAEEAQQNLENVPNKSKQPAQEKTRKVNYNYKCPVNLIRFMRNGYTHIHSFTSRKTDGTRTLADDLGSNVIEMEKTFRYLFPDLFVSVYEVVEKHIDSLPHSLKMCYQA